METKGALIAIIVSDKETTIKLNELSAGWESPTGRKESPL